MDLLSSEVKSNFEELTYSRELKKLKELENALKYTGIQARLPFEIEID